MREKDLFSFSRFQKQNKILFKILIGNFLLKIVKILAVDDSPLVRNMIIKTLKIKGDSYKVETAENGLIAVEKYEKFKPDLVLLDITMPGMDGVEALSRIMQMDNNATVVMVTSAGTSDVITLCMKKGARGHIEKPFSPSELVETIKKLTKPDMDYDRIATLYSRVSSKMEKSLRKMLDDSISLALSKVDVEKERPEIEIPEDSVGITTKVEGERSGIIVSVINKEQLRTLLLAQNNTSELEDEENASIEFFNTMNNNFLTEFLNYTHQNLRILPPKFFKDEDNSIPAREFIKILYDITWKDVKIPMKIHQFLT